jgi:hypothetical protein
MDSKKSTKFDYDLKYIYIWKAFLAALISESARVFIYFRKITFNVNQIVLHLSRNPANNYFDIKYFNNEYNVTFHSKT